MDRLKNVPRNLIDSIKQAKNIYGILKYQQQSEEFKDYMLPRYMRALYLNNGDINENMYDDTVEFLENAKKDVDSIRNDNQPIIDDLVSKIMKELEKMFNDGDSNIVACARIFQYVTKTIKYSQDLLDYEHVIPFASEYRFECYNGIPLGKNFEDLLVTKEGTSFEIANLMVFLGSSFNIPIKAVPVLFNGGTYYINSFETNKGISYMDPTSVIVDRNTDGVPCLVPKSYLEKIGMVFDADKEEGVKFDIDIKNASNVEKAISRERNTLGIK